MIGDNLWMVMVNGKKFKGDMTEEEAIRMATKWDYGLNKKHKDMRDYVEIKRDKALIREVDGYYKEAKRGNMQQYHTIQWKE